MSRWTFTDLSTSETYVMDLSPNAMKSLGPAHSTQVMAFSPFDGRVFAWRKPDAGIADWSFSGVVTSQEAHDALVAWYQRSSRIKITDHYGRQITCRFTGLDMAVDRPSGKNAWRHKYTVTAYVYEVV